MDYFENLTVWGAVKDAADILIVSYLIYRMILLVRGTKAVQLLKGILLLVLTWALSTWLNLFTLKWVMNQLFPFGIMTILIIFQPELRRALEQLGRGTLFSRSSQEEHDISHPINEVIKSVQYLARRKIGALIVFERRTGLGDYIETGIKMKSAISSELLINIFIPNTPLHDGAVIVSGGEIMAAGCYLPLSENPFISKELGTRHRAAIGISEVCDAISIVVSEETGHVSLALNGQIVRDIKEESLISKLFDELRQNNAKKARRSWSIPWKFWDRKGGDGHG
ncbi:diadenylate cyclase CdaA [Cohnella sp. JJ-181]|uniref:diadenylate cyclase CdaA n=1 Tax=Cohnella rhizoplanae TaxID=2974897 RepID=UPI0022FF50A2|nr:diadenylate cyclase CdaA [Cohnella sp. JJ-181]CAI6083382.1 Cyclic di-AMP synthase CdaA [Cohnella sp. JJ-181]